MGLVGLFEDIEPKSLNQYDDIKLVIPDIWTDNSSFCELIQVHR